MTDLITRQNAVLQELRGLAQQIVDVVAQARAVDPSQPVGPDNQDLFPDGLTDGRILNIHVAAQRYLYRVAAQELTEQGGDNGGEN